MNEHCITGFLFYVVAVYAQHCQTTCGITCLLPNKREYRQAMISKDIGLRLPKK